MVTPRKYEIKNEENKIDYKTEFLLETPIETIETWNETQIEKQVETIIRASYMLVFTDLSDSWYRIIEIDKMRHASQSFA